MSTLGKFERLERRSTSLSTSSSLRLWRHPFDKHTLNLFMLLKSEISVSAEIQGLPSLRLP